MLLLLERKGVRGGRRIRARSSLRAPEGLGRGLLGGVGLKPSLRYVGTYRVLWTGWTERNRRQDRGYKLWSGWLTSE